MSAGAVDLQAQVESVLGALVKAATVELTKLFESRYGASPVEVEVGRSEDKEKAKTSRTLDKSTDTKRSIGVQVENDMYPLLEVSGPAFLSDDDLLSECGEEIKVVEGCLIPAEVLLAEDDGYIDSDLLALKEQVLSDTVDMVEVNVLQTEFPTNSEAQTDTVLHVSAEAWTKTLTFESTQKDAAKQKPIVIQPDTSNVTSDDKVKFVCPLILKPESPAPDSSEKQFQVEPQQGCVSTAKGTAYSPSLSDGAMTPAQAGIWERIHTPNDTKNNLHMKLKLTSADQKLMRSCIVQLVDVLMVSKSGRKLEDCANHKTDLPLPKDLRHHQGLHTGHRICCFTSCGNDVWRLQKVVAHSHDRYVCSICGKNFKRRKSLRRHERFHTGDKPYSCSVCCKMFALRKSLRRHLRFHTGERPHTCTQCGKSFRLRDNLKAHLRFHTGEKPFSCTTCGKMFRIMRNLEKHKLAECELCVPSFRTIAGL